MRYSSDHKAATRERLLDKAGALAKRQGFASTGVDAMVAEAGLTAGAFYVHFGSKSDMLKALLEKEMAASMAMFGDADSPLADAELAQRIAAYLSIAHVEHPEAGCCLPTLTAEVARADDGVRDRFEQAIQQLQARLCLLMDGDSDRAWSVLAQAVGAVMLARAMRGKPARKAVLDAVKRQILPKR